MVFSNRGYPDPDNPSEDVSPNSEIIVAAETDTEEEDNHYNDYEPLPMNDIGDLSDDDVNSSDEEDACGNTEQSLPPITRIEDTLVKEVWSAPVPKSLDIEMDSSKVDQVKQAMVNFTLPPTAFPEWAHNIPEEQWKQQFIKRLQQSKEK